MKKEIKIKPEEIGKRIRKIRKNFDLSQAKFGEMLGIKYYKVKDLESGVNKLSPELALKIEEVFGVRFEWLYTGRGKMFIEKDSKNFEDSYHDITNFCEKKLNISFIPLVKKIDKNFERDNLSAENIIGYYPFNNDYLKKLEVTPHKAILFKMVGDSMSSLIDEDDIVLIDLNEKFLYDGKIYVIFHNDSFFIKKIILDFDKVILKSENEKYHDIIVDMSKINEENIFGRIKWIGRIV